MRLRWVSLEAEREPQVGEGRERLATSWEEGGIAGMMRRGFLGT